jgi:hypothetical protein
LIELEEQNRIGDSDEQSQEVKKLHNSKEVWLHVSFAEVQNKPKENNTSLI